MYLRVVDRVCLLAVVFSTACVDTEVRRSVSGELDSSVFRLDRSEAIAISTDGQKWRSPLDEQGAFRFSLRVGRAYEIRFANATAVPGVVDEFAYLTQTGPDGTRQRTFTLVEGPPIRLGRVDPVQVYGVSGSALRAAGADDSDADSQDVDTDSVDVDSDSEADLSGRLNSEAVDVCELSGGSDMVEVQPGENSPGLPLTASNRANPQASAQCEDVQTDIDMETGCDCQRWGKNNNGHGNNADGVDISNPGNGSGGPNGEVDQSAPIDDENKGLYGGVGGANPCTCICERRAKNNNGHGNNADGVDISNPGNGSGGPNGEVDQSAPVDDENKGLVSGSTSGGSGVSCDSFNHGGHDGQVCIPPDAPPDPCGPGSGDVPPNPGVDPNAPTGDADGDGIPNFEDGGDADEDGIPDFDDPTPGGDANNPSDPAGDADGDGVPNAFDGGDSDGDGVPDLVDPTPGGDTNNPCVPAGDADGDGLANINDTGDADGDGIADQSDLMPAANSYLRIGDSDEPNALGGDADGDGRLNVCDEGDSDGDGVPDRFDPTPGGDPSNICAPAGDADGDGVANSNEVAESFSTAPQAFSDPNLSVGDADHDGVRNGCDEGDADGDGTPDWIDPTPGGDPFDPNAPAGDADGDGIPNANDGGDADGDGILDPVDGSPAGGLGAPASDDDGDGIPNSRDPDDDGDGIPDGSDPDRNGDGIPEDIDGDGIPDVQDLDDDGDGILDPVDGDSDGDGFPNDSDGDGIPDISDSDDDNDGSPDPVDGDRNGDGIPEDDDLDGIPNFSDEDDDGDGILDPVDGDRNGDGIPDDSDGDGIPDYDDPDRDGDAVLDPIDGNPDSYTPIPTSPPDAPECSSNAECGPGGYCNAGRCFSV